MTKVTFHFSHNERHTTTMEIRKDGHALGVWMIDLEEATRMRKELITELEGFVPPFSDGKETQV